MTIERETTSELHARVLWVTYVDASNPDERVEVIRPDMVDNILNNLSMDSNEFEETGESRRTKYTKGRLVEVGYSLAKTGSISGPDCKDRFSYEEFDEGLSRKRTITVDTKNTYG